jgi:hypothetical protein
MRKQARREGEVYKLINGQWATILKVNGRLITYNGSSRKQVADWLRSVKYRKYRRHRERSK